MNSSPLVMPFSNVMHLAYSDKLKATRSAGFSEMSIQPQEVKRVMAVEGLSLADIRLMANDAGVRISRLDPLCTWVPEWQAVNFGPEFNQAHDTEPGEFFDIARALGATIMSLNATFPRGRYTLTQLAEYFASIDQQASDNGLVCDLEAIPMWGLRTIEEAWTVVRESGSSTGGVVFDAVHFIRGGCTMAMLEALPGERIHCVQLDDGPLTLGPGVTLEDDCFLRLWPGQGEFPLVEMLKVLKQKNALREVCAEVFSLDNAKLSVQEVASLSRETLEPILARAGIRDEDIHRVGATL